LEVVVKLSKSMVAVAAFAAVSAASASCAAVIDWTLQDVFLSDGSAVTGTFDYDADANAYSNIDITVAAGPNYSDATNLTVSIPVNGAAIQPFWFEAVTGNYAGDATGLRQLFLVFANSLTDSGGTVVISQNFESPQFSVCKDPVCLLNDPNFPIVEGGNGQGFVTTDPASPGVPEPAAWALMLMGFGGLGAMLRRRSALLA
jgi:PEP-CTERM motif